MVTIKIVEPLTVRVDFLVLYDAEILRNNSKVTKAIAMESSNRE